MDDKLLINVTIADRMYHYSVEPELEELLRNSVKDISSRLTVLKSRYSLKDNQDALAILLLQYVTQLLKIRKEDLPGVILREIEHLDKQLDEYISANVE